MTEPDFVRVNFTLSTAAKAAIERLRRDYDARSPRDPAAILSIGWGLAYAKSGADLGGGIVIGFYPQSMLPGVAHGTQEVSGVKFIYFTIPPHHLNFEGKVLDHSEERDFFLRDP